MSALLAAARLGAMHRFAWRFEAATSLLAALGVVLATASLWTAAAGSGPIAGLERGALATYVVVAWLVSAAVGGRVEAWVGERMESGEVVADLLRPVDLHAFVLARHLGRSAAALALTAAPACALMALWSPIVLPSAPARWVAFALAVALAALVGGQLGYLVGLAARPLGGVYGLAHLKAALVWLLSGALIPVGALPEPVSWIARATPFPALADLPARALIGDTPLGVWLDVLLPQLGWVLALALACRLAQSATLRRLVAWGG